MIIIGNGDGTFQPYQRADQTVSLAVGNFGGNGQTEYVLSNTSIDQLSIQYGETQSFVQGRSQGIQAPGAVAVADLNGDGNPDIIVLNTGENDMLVYLGLGGNRFAAPLHFFTGTDPVGLTVADLTGDGVPDIIVANAGSNDLSIFIGIGQGAAWTLEPRPRLQVGNDPVSTTVADVYGNGIPDIICVDQGSDNVEVLRGVGGGFFDDTDPLVLPAGPDPIRAFVGRFDAGPGPDLAVLDSGSSDLTDYSNFVTGNSAPQEIPTGGPSPVAGAMGSSAIDGYAVLFIAHQGDSRISMLQGSSTGFVLADSIFLGQSVQPSDLAVSGGESGDLDLYVSAQGQNRVILVNIMPGLGTFNPAPLGERFHGAGNSSARQELEQPLAVGEPRLAHPRRVIEGIRRARTGLGAGGDTFRRPGRQFGPIGYDRGHHRHSPPAGHRACLRLAGVLQQPRPDGAGPDLRHRVPGSERHGDGRRPAGGIGPIG